VCLPARSAPPTERHRAGDPSHSDNPAPLSVCQLWALASSATRELVWGLRAVARELRAWRQRAAQIPDSPIRSDALAALARKRGNTDGAALFWTIPKTRNHDLLELLVRYQVMWDFLDSASETGAAAGYTNGIQLHLALVEAVDPHRPISDYYRHHPWKDDGGYLRSLVEACRASSARLASFERVRPLLVREAYRANVQALNHDPAADRRDAALREWAAREYASRRDVSWFELAAAAGAGISIYALFALAVEPVCTDADMADVHRAYFPWASALATMLDSYVDQHEDAASGNHIYIEHYPSPVLAGHGTRRLIGRSLAEAKALPNGERHTVVIACMIAMYLSKDNALRGDMRDTTGSLLDAAGPLTKLLLPILWLWRSAYGQKEL
jgi:tetraprenyl-beta-curcumene synthase